ncbi:major facilitator superfamily domain-containing protein [Fusarium solani]|uniref:Major facilitator superfamily domain-containing protein n=1 Tax=Fusarium solani TaxID=169388 RepID=A0A9P9L6C7_FUSSL|nr:major facilitator superfamily domain-containing protein [Fusarium solani]KAH7274775.1 major facilitator superfamily domain-containing protein [Fusarium solani]
MEMSTVAMKPSSRSEVIARYNQNVEQRAKDPDYIFYDGEDLRGLDPDLVVLSSDVQQHPRNWPNKKKWTVTLLVGAYCFLAPFTSTIFAPSLSSVMTDTAETDPGKAALHIAMFLIAFAAAPVFLAPLSEMYGRSVVLRSGNLVFAAFCLGSGFCQTTSQLVVCRFFAGMGGSAALAVMGGVLSDIWNLEERGGASGALGTAIVMGPVLGPVCGGWMSERASWRWTCWVPAIAAVGLEVISTFSMDESYAPTLLKRELKRQKKQRPGAELYTVLDLHASNGSKATISLFESASRPIMYLLLDPALLLLSLYYAFVFGVLYLVIVTFHRVFGEGYSHSPGIVGVDMTSEGIGALLGMVGTTKLLGVIYRKQIKSENYRAESRLISAFAGALLVGSGLLIYGFTALKTHFIVPLIGVVVFSSGMTNAYLAIQLYIIDSYEYSASAIAGLSVLRCLFAGVFPLFGDQLFDSIGVNWGVGLLALLSLCLGLPFLPLIYVYGPRLRDVGKRNRRRVFESDMSKL